MSTHSADITTKKSLPVISAIKPIIWRKTVSSATNRQILLPLLLKLNKQYKAKCTFQILFEGVSGSEDRGGGDNSIQFINIGRVGDKSFKEWRQKIGGGRVGDSNILTFLCYWLDKKCHLKNCILGNFFPFIYVKFLNS